jgi:hypothetical protein
MEHIREYRPAAGTPLTIAHAFTLARACTRRAYAEISYKPTGSPTIQYIVPFLPTPTTLRHPITTSGRALSKQHVGHVAHQLYGERSEAASSLS